MMKRVNGVDVEMTPQELAEWEAGQVPVDSNPLENLRPMVAALPKPVLLRYAGQFLMVNEFIADRNYAELGGLIIALLDMMDANNDTDAQAAVAPIADLLGGLQG